MRFRGIFLSFLLMTAAAAQAEIHNPAFSGKDNQVSVNFAQSRVKAGLKLEELFFLGVCYSQPNHFFRLPGRQNAELMTQFGLGEFSKYNQDLIFGFSQDVISPGFWRMYAGMNLGIYIKTHITDRIGSRFTFGQRYFLGVNVWNDIGLELYARHFSNGDLAKPNHGQNFLGLSVLWSF
jgi:hypothetical protein